MRALVLGAAMLAGQVDAQPACPEVPVITAMAEQVLDLRPGAGRFAARRAGALAAYLLIHYGGHDDATALALLETLETAEPPLSPAPEMITTFLIRTQGPAPALTRNGADPLQGLDRMASAPLRALLLHDLGASYFALLARLRDREGGFTADMSIMAQRLPYLLMDQDSDTRAAIARAAQGAGFDLFAATLAAGLPDLSLLDAVQAGWSAPDGAPDWLREPSMDWMANTPGYLDRPRFGAGDTDEARRSAQGRHDVQRAAIAAGDSSYLGTFVNQTGQEQAGARAARALLEAVAAGRTDPARNPEPGWLLVHDALVADLGAAAVDAGLQGFDWPFGSLRHYAGPAGAAVAMMRARAAYGPWIRGEDANPPAPVAGTDTAAWTRLGQLARDGGLDPDAPAGDVELAIAVEVLELRRDWPGITALAQARLSPQEHIRVLDDLMRRLDLGCDGVATVRGLMLITGGEPLLDFRRH